MNVYKCTRKGKETLCVRGGGGGQGMVEGWYCCSVISVINEVFHIIHLQIFPVR